MAQIRIRLEEPGLVGAEAVVECKFYDTAGIEAYYEAVEAVHAARVDGQEKYSGEAWQNETVENQLLHAADHLQAMGTVFNVVDAQHAICRLVFALALAKREQKA